MARLELISMALAVATMLALVSYHAGKNFEYEDRAAYAVRVRSYIYETGFEDGLKACNASFH
mgnify:CR=1 FL=1